VIDPTEDDLKGEYPEWETMTSTEKRLAKESLVNKQRFQIIHEARKAEKNIEAWKEKVDTFIDNPQSLIDNPELEGKQEEFKAFASKPTRSGSDFDILIGAFLHDATKNAKPKQKGSMFPTGNGGPNDKPAVKADKLTVEQGRALRQTNYSEWREKLKAGKIASE